MAPNYRDLQKMIYERENYTTLIEKVSQLSISTASQIFSIDSSLIVSPYTDCLNYNDLMKNLKGTNGCYEKNKKNYPSYLTSNQIEGKINLYFIVNSDGRAVNPVVNPVYFRYFYKYENISSSKKINRINRRIKKDIIKSYTECISSIQFDIPMSLGGPINVPVKLPLLLNVNGRD
jgi:hypothetical protein